MARREQVTQEILGLYREIGSQPTLREWRKKVPVDARKSWARHMITNVGWDKMTDPELGSIVDAHLAPDHPDKNTILRLREKIGRTRQELEEARDEVAANPPADDEYWDPTEPLEERLMDLFAEYEHVIGGVTNNDMLIDFAQRYFATFETDPEKIRLFFEQQKQQIDIIAPAAQLLPELQALIVCGSSAIGPRKTHYRTQDIDLLFVPTSTATEENKDRLLQFHNTIVHLDSLVSDARHPRSERRAQEKLAHFPGWDTAVEYATAHSLKLDLWAAEDNGWDWPKLVGPHRIVKTFSPDWESHYQHYLQQSIARSRFGI